MASKSALTRPKVALSVDRSAADCSYIRNFHSHAGLLDMVMCEPCIKGTKGVINRKTFTRTSQVLFPAFVGCKEYFDFFKVPLRYLWSKWLDWDVNINDANSSMLAFMSSGNVSLVQPTNVPRCDFEDITTWINQYILGSNSLSLDDEVQLRNNALRILEQAGIKPSQAGTNSHANVCNIFKLGAYQKVYYDHYRNTTYESNDPFAYNFDWLYDGGITGNGRAGLLGKTSADDIHVLKSLLTMRYVNWNNDFFHNIYPALNYTISQPSGLTWSLPSNVVYQLTPSAGNNPNIVNTTNGSGGQVVLDTNQYTQGSYTYQNLSVQQIRAAFALDKLMRASAYAPKHVRDQIKARFGVDVGDNVSYETEKIGSYVSDVQFGEVTQTVNTASTGSNLGSVGGKGLGSDDWGKDLHFYCDEDCLIVGIHYFVPTGMYDSPQDEWNQKLIREDFFQPEFQNLGLRPILRKNVIGSQILLYSMASYENQILGYTVPNELYKVGKNVNYGMFKDEYAHYVKDTSGNSVLFQHTNTSPLSAFTTHVNKSYQNLVLNLPMTYEYFKVKPEVLDSIMADPFDGTLETDQFFGLCRIKFAKVHPMDVHGQPSL